MSSSGSVGASRNEDVSSEQDDRSETVNSPLWSYVEVKEKSKNRGGNVKFKCKLCHLEFNGSLFRITGHLLKIKNRGIKPCPKVTIKVLSQLQKEVEEAEAKAKQNQPRMVPFATTPTTSDSFSSPLGLTLGTGSFRVPGVEPFDSRKRKASISSPLDKLANDERVQQLDSQIARMFYSGGLPFHLARNPYYISSFTYAANNNIIGYLPPGYNKLRTTLLQKERGNIERLLEPIKMKWKENGLSLVSDGWSDAQRRPLINFMATSESGAMFLNAVNCEGEVKDKTFMANLIKEQIRMVGEENVVQVITDSALVCRAAGWRTYGGLATA